MFRKRKMPYSKNFKKLLKSVKETYLGKEVKPKYKKKYGSVYDLDELESIAFGIAKGRGIKIDKKK